MSALAPAEHNSVLPDSAPESTPDSMPDPGLRRSARLLKRVTFA